MRDAWISISATRPWTSGSAGSSSARMRAHPERVLAQLGPQPVDAAGRRVALVEDQVDDLQHRAQPGAPARRRGAPRGTRASARVRLARTIRCATVDSRTRKARAISPVWSPPNSRSVNAVRASVESTGWQVVNRSGAGRRRSDRRARRRDRARWWQARAPGGGRAGRVCARPSGGGAACRRRGAWRCPSARRPGCPGCPTRGHCSSAATSASWARSSARPTSRT